jgi:tyrosinase
MSTGTGTTIKVRKNAIKMAKWDPALLWYAKAVAVMKTRAQTDPTSWGYQAAMHGFTLNPTEDAPAAAIWAKWTKNQTLPGKPEQDTYWKRCQHGSWYFLPWHRMYLGFFEMIVGQTITALGGPPNWALPYWNYNQGVATGLPTAFTEAQLPPPGKTPNPLREPSRSAGNNGSPFLKPDDVDPANAFEEPEFAGATHGGTPGFGGPVTLFEHAGRSHGLLEQQPHDVVHDEVGGVMGDPLTAAYDPIFWLHHANIDRLWQIWLNADPAHKNPILSKWQKFSFVFHDATGKIQTLKPQDVIDTNAVPFYYGYDDLSLPAGVAAGIPPAPSGGPAEEALDLISKKKMPETPVPEMVGASSGVTPLKGEAKTLNVPLFPMSGPMSALGAADAHFRKAYLHVENIRGRGRPASYDVYLNVAEGAEKRHRRFRVGIIPTFGLEQASAATERHAGNGLHFTFNVTKTVNLLKEENQWNPGMLRVSFVPRRKPAEGSSIQVGRVSLYYT